MAEKKDKKDSTKAPSISSLLAAPSPGDHVYRLHLQASNGKYLSVEAPSHLIVAKAELAGPDSVFELHQVGDGRYAIRSAFGKFLNVDDNIDLCAKEKSGKDPGLRADRDPGEGGSALTEAEKCFQLVEVPGGRVSLRAAEDYFIAVEPGETKTKLVKNAVAAAHSAALATAMAAAAAVANVAAANASAAAAAAAAAVAAAVPPSTPTAAGASSSAATPTATSTSASFSSTTPSAAASVAAAPSPPLLPPSPVDFCPSPAELFTPVWLDQRSPLTLSGRVVVRTAHAKLWCAEPSGAFVANRTRVALWEPVVVVPQSLTHVAFQSVHGTFLALQPAAAGVSAGGGSGGASLPRPKDQCLLAFTSSSVAGPAEQFQVVEVDKRAGRFAFRAANGLFLCAQGNHQVTASSRQQGPWEQFALTPWTHMP